MGGQIVVEGGYLGELGEAVWVGVPGVEDQEGDLEGGLGEGQGDDLVGVQGAVAGASAPLDHLAYQAASKTVEHRVEGREAGQRVDQEASLEELGVVPTVEVLFLVDPACVEVVAVLPLVQRVEACADWV